MNRVEAGRVVVTKRVVEEPETARVTLQHDELDLERRPVDRPLEPGEQPITTRGDETVLLVVEERLELRRVPFVVEEIHMRRRIKRGEREITEPVSKERFEIDVKGDIRLNQADVDRDG